MIATERGAQDMGSRGSEDDKFRPPGHLIERPMNSGDATGAPTPGKRHDREVAYRAWVHLTKHDPNEMLPDWVLEYLRSVAGRLVESLGENGGLSPAAAHAAINMVGEGWPDHPAEKVHMIMRRWMESEGMGRKAAAVRYIEEHMGDDKNVPHSFVINKYKKGRKVEQSGEG